jgi:thiamine monophosphate synthase
VTPSRQPLAEALRLVVILDTGVAREVKADLETVARGAALGGATMLQIRAKHESAADVAELTRRVMAAVPALPVLVDDRLDVAIAAGAAGCHLGQDDFPIDAALAMVPPALATNGSEFEISILGKRHRATIIPESPFDPKNERLRA